MRLHELEEHFSRLCILCHCTERNVQDDVRSVLSLLELSAACRTMLCHDVLAIFQVDKSPELRIRPEDDVSSTSAVSSVRSSLRDILLPPHMRRARTSIARTAIDLYIVYEIRIRHIVLLEFVHY